VGYLSPAASVNAAPAVEPFRQGLRALGYVEGQNIVIEWRFTKGDAEQFPGFAAEMARLKVDCIVTQGIPAIRSAKQATRTIPIVMNVGDDPVQLGLISNLARPEGDYWLHEHRLRLSRETSGAAKGIIPQSLSCCPCMGRSDGLGSLPGNGGSCPCLAGLASTSGAERTWRIGECLPNCGQECRCAHGSGGWLAQ
jgi:ABC-type uncharacterized transport system, periplasmic component